MEIFFHSHEVTLKAQDITIHYNSLHHSIHRSFIHHGASLLLSFLLCHADQPLTACQRQLLDFYSSPPSPGKYAPQCSSDGRYLKVQCNPQHDECWCVNSDGSEVLRTRTPGPIRCPEPGSASYLILLYSWDIHMLHMFIFCGTPTYLLN